MPRQVLVFLLLTIPALGFGATTVFKSPQDYSAGGANAISVAVADLNGDGKPDVVVANGCIICGTGAVFGVGVLLGNGDGTFQTAHNYPVGGDLAPISVAIGDVNRDGKPDVVVTSECFSDNNCGGVSVLLGNGDGSFQTAVTYDSGGMSPRGMTRNSTGRCQPRRQSRLACDQLCSQRLRRLLPC
jgi:FG-GAP-like repeat